MNINNLASLIYFIIFLSFSFYFYFGSKLIFRKNIKESLILAIGSASVSKILIFTIILPKYFNTAPIYPSTSSIITLIVVVIYGVYLGKTTESEKPQPKDNCEKR